MKNNYFLFLKHLYVKTIIRLPIAIYRPSLITHQNFPKKYQNLLGKHPLDRSISVQSLTAKINSAKSGRNRFGSYHRKYKFNH